MKYCTKAYARTDAAFCQGFRGCLPPSSWPRTIATVVVCVFAAGWALVKQNQDMDQLAADVEKVAAAAAAAGSSAAAGR